MVKTSIPIVSYPAEVVWSFSAVLKYKYRNFLFHFCTRIATSVTFLISLISLVFECVNTGDILM